MPHILIVEDEAAIADTLVYALQSDGHSTHWTMFGRDALNYLYHTAVDLVILDVGLPDQNGFELCRTLRRDSDVPVLFLTARDSEIDRVVGLEIGADDYVVKPFSPREVAARVRRILDRTLRSTTSRTEAQAPEFVIDVERARIRYRDVPLELTPHQFHILACLVRRPEQVFSRDQLLEAAGISTGAGYGRNIDTHVKDLRAKLKAVAAHEDPIRTHRGFGYSYQPTGPRRCPSP
ncbi:MAG: two-component system response regulator CreB [Pseudomonadales bacterium]|nr:two-component system response regulator CreB [Pseudomonadales bacterium]